MKRVYYLAKHFLKVFFAFRINFVGILIIPVFGVVYQQSPLIFQEVQTEEFFQYIAIWLAYMTTMSGFTIGHQVVSLREHQFLKQMKFVARDYKQVIYAQITVHFLLLIGTATILTLTSAILFGMPFFTLLFFNYVVALLPFIPISLVFLVLNLFPIHRENLQPLFTVATMAMVFFTNFLTFSESLSTWAVVLNPMNFSLEAGKIGAALFLSNLEINYLGVAVAAVIYLSIGVYSLKNTRIIANFRM